MYILAFSGSGYTLIYINFFMVANGSKHHETWLKWCFVDLKIFNFLHFLTWQNFDTEKFSEKISNFQKWSKSTANDLEHVCLVYTGANTDINIRF